MIFLEHRLDVLTEFLNVLDKVRVDVGLASANTIIVLNESSAGGLLHNVKHLLAVAHTINKCSERSEVLSTTAVEQQVRVKTLKLVHYGADILNTVRKLNAHTFFDNRYKRMTVHHG